MPLKGKYLYQFAEEMPVDWLIWIFLDYAAKYPMVPRIAGEMLEGKRKDLVTVVRF